MNDVSNDLSLFFLQNVCIVYIFRVNLQTVFETMNVKDNMALAAGMSRIGNLLAYISSQVPGVPMRKMLKLLYLIDENAVRTRSIPLTWLTYYAWAKGPVAADVYYSKESHLFSDYVDVKSTADGKIRFYPCSSHVDMADFSKVELQIIDSVISEYGTMSSDELTEMTHQPDSLWSKVVRDNGIVFDSEHKTSDVVVALDDLLVGEGLDTYNDAKECMEFQAALNRA